MPGAAADSSSLGSPTHSEPPDAKCCSFQIGTSALRVLIKCAHAASASPR